uniref:Uncharacterized protein n=1 Tax=Chromera velia CCMP2878 TaxID=1169474 RepID=A0A0G4GLL9_9ALVE|eukprot:Cvel_22447.t1-p1 / transcript=Cvel_22447.t1 / gene=Cvel_22447 / organism=Chromera_velia_CCMP2878 / gene_product=hypothetical protein / transcript_product=hypothetical protein / location=Cvel_scaffold2206:22381-24611(+) / protein_length=525 / sequence_SO=supercontig / SO=protein_coding / is_pseudo=false
MNRSEGTMAVVGSLKVAEKNLVEGLAVHAESEFLIQVLDRSLDSLCEENEERAQTLDAFSLADEVAAAHTLHSLLPAPPLSDPQLEEAQEDVRCLFQSLLTGKSEEGLKRPGGNQKNDSLRDRMRKALWEYAILNSSGLDHMKRPRTADPVRNLARTRVQRPGGGGDSFVRDRDLCDCIESAVIALWDRLSHVLRWCLFEMAQHPLVMCVLRRSGENEGFPVGRKRGEKETEIDFKNDVCAAFVLETLRLHPYRQWTSLVIPRESSFDFCKILPSGPVSIVLPERLSVTLCTDVMAKTKCVADPSKIDPLRYADPPRGMGEKPPSPEIVLLSSESVALSQAGGGTLGVSVSEWCLHRAALFCAGVSERFEILPVEPQTETAFEEGQGMNSGEGVSERLEMESVGGGEDEKEGTLNPSAGGGLLSSTLPKGGEERWRKGGDQGTEVGGWLPSLFRLFRVFGRAVVDFFCCTKGNAKLFVDFGRVGKPLCGRNWRKLSLSRSQMSLPLRFRLREGFWRSDTMEIARL